MNGKMAKMLRKMGKDSNSDKRIFNSFDASTKAALRNAVKNYHPSQVVAQAAVDSDEVDSK